MASVARVWQEAAILSSCLVWFRFDMQIISFCCLALPVAGNIKGNWKAYSHSFDFC